MLTLQPKRSTFHVHYRRYVDRVLKCSNSQPFMKISRKLFDYFMPYCITFYSVSSNEGATKQKESSSSQTSHQERSRRHSTRKQQQSNKPRKGSNSSRTQQVERRSRSQIYDPLSKWTTILLIP